MSNKEIAFQIIASWIIIVLLFSIFFLVGEYTKSVFAACLVMLILKKIKNYIGW